MHCISWHFACVFLRANRKIQNYNYKNDEYSILPQLKQIISNSIQSNAFKSLFKE